MVTKRSRIIFVNRFFFPDESATSQLLTDLAFSLAQQGHEVHILCSRQLYDFSNDALSAREIVRGVMVHRLQVTRFGRATIAGRAIDYLSFYISCSVFLVALIRKSDIVVAKTDPPLISIFAALAVRMRRGILINWLQDIYPEIATKLGILSLPKVIVGWLAHLRNASLRVARTNVVLGTRMYEHLLAEGIPARQLRIIENWCVTEWPEPISQLNSELRAELDLQGCFVVQYSGNLGRAHDYQTLLSAAEILRHEGHIVFLMIGGGAHMDILKSCVEAKGLKNFIFLPSRPLTKLSDSLAAADVHLVTLLPALEGLIVPSKFYGILAAGRPTLFLGDPDGELARAIKSIQCGVVVEVGCPGKLVEAIISLRNDEPTRRSMGKSARTLLVDRYGAARARAMWASVVNEMVES